MSATAIETNVATQFRLRRIPRRLSTPSARPVTHIQFCRPLPPSLEALDLSTASSPTQVLASLRFLVLSYLEDLEKRLSLLDSPDIEAWRSKGELTIEETRQWAMTTVEMLESLRNDVYLHLPGFHLADISMENFKAHLPDFPDVPSISEMRFHLPDVPSMDDMRSCLPDLPDVPSIHDMRSHLPGMPDVRSHLPAYISSRLDDVRTKFHDIDFHQPLDFIPTLSARLKSLQLHLSGMELPIGLPGPHSMLYDLLDSLLSSELVSDIIHADAEDDIFDIAAREVTHAIKRSFEGVRLIKYTDLPQQWRHNPFVTQGYRFIPIERWPLIVMSLFAFHNEFLNIHTHLIPCLLWTINSIPFVNPDGLADTPETLFMMFALLCLFSSAVWHTMSGCAHSASMEFCARVDYVGIGWLISASVGTIVHYGFQCHPTLRTAFLAGCFATGLAGNICPFMKWFNEIEYRSWRIAFFLSLAFTSIAPLAALAILHSPTEMFAFISPVVPSLISYIIGLVFYATHVPERFLSERWNRKLDAVGGGSHCIWHCFIVLAVSQHKTAMRIIKSGFECSA